MRIASFGIYEITAKEFLKKNVHIFVHFLLCLSLS